MIAAQFTMVGTRTKKLAWREWRVSNQPSHERRSPKITLRLTNQPWRLRPGSNRSACRACADSSHRSGRDPGALSLSGQDFTGLRLQHDGPYVDHELSATRTFLYQPDTNARRPLAALKLKNDGESALPAGILTAFETGSDGAANYGRHQMPLTPKGAEKFVTFALESKPTSAASTIVRNRPARQAVRGLLTVSVKSNWVIDYEITPPSGGPRHRDR